MCYPSETGFYRPLLFNSKNRIHQAGVTCKRFQSLPMSSCSHPHYGWWNCLSQCRDSGDSCLNHSMENSSATLVVSFLYWLTPSNPTALFIFALILSDAFSGSGVQVHWSSIRGASAGEIRWERRLRPCHWQPSRPRLLAQPWPDGRPGPHREIHRGWTSRPQRHLLLCGGWTECKSWMMVKSVWLGFNETWQSDVC